LATDGAGLLFGAAPAFTAPVLGDTARVMSLSELTGQDTVILFVRPTDSASELDKQLSASVHGLRERGRLCVVCCGGLRDCQSLLPEIQVGLHNVGDVPILLDTDEAIARLFQVKRTPVAFHLNSEAHIVSVGRQQSSTS